MKTVAIVGASLAGLQAARALRNQGYDGRLVLIGEEVHRPYDRPPLSKDFLAGRITAADLALEDTDEALAAEWLLGTPAIALDTGCGAVLLADGRQVAADGVVVATGARPRMLPGCGPAAGIHTLRSIDDALALRADLLPGARLVVIGAGFIGGEVASTARALGCEVTVLEAQPTPLAGPLGARMGAVVSGLHEDHGVRLLCGVGVRQLVVGNRVEAVRLADGTLLPADVVVVGVGATPNIEWLEGSGLALGDGVQCDERGRTGVPGVVAVGDCAAWQDGQRGGRRRIEHWTAALERPALAARALLAGAGAVLAADRPVTPPYFWSDQYGVRIQFAGHAADADSVTVEAGSVMGRDLLAVYRRGEQTVGVLGMNQARLFGRWRRQLHPAPVAA